MHGYICGGLWKVALCLTQDVTSIEVVKEEITVIEELIELEPDCKCM